MEASRPNGDLSLHPRPCPRPRPPPPGEYAERIDNADELLEAFLETFPEETAPVQLQLLTATVKLFLKKPTEVRGGGWNAAPEAAGHCARAPKAARRSSPTPPPPAPAPRSRRSA